MGAFIRRRDSSARPDTANVLDRGDGTYSIRVAPPKPGAYLLAVTLNNKPINVSNDLLEIWSLMATTEFKAFLSPFFPIDYKRSFQINGIIVPIAQNLKT